MDQKARKEFVKLINDVEGLPEGKVKETIQNDIIHVLDALIEQMKYEKTVLSGEDIE